MSMTTGGPICSRSGIGILNERPPTATTATENITSATSAPTDAPNTPDVIELPTA